MNRRRLAAALAAQSDWCVGRSPLYAAVLAELADDAERAAWPERLDRAWRGREFAVDWEAAHLLLAGMHYAALAGEAPELAALYPSNADYVAAVRRSNERAVRSGFLLRPDADLIEAWAEQSGIGG